MIRCDDVMLRFFLLWLLSGLVWGKTYLIATDYQFPPFEFKKDGRYVGIDIDLFEEIAKLEGIEYEFRYLDFSEIVPSIANGQLDGGISAVTVTDDRKKLLDFSDSYYETGLVAVVREGDNSVKGESDIAGKIVAVKAGTTAAIFARERLIGKSKIRVYTTTTDAFEAVARREADVMLADYLVARYTLLTTPNLNLKITTDRLTSGSFAFMVKKGENQDLLKKFNDGLKKVKDSGKFDEIVERYVGSQ